MLPSNRHLFYLKGLSQLILPRKNARLARLHVAWQAMSDAQKQRIHTRVNYCNRLDKSFDLSSDAKAYSELTLKGHRSRYFLDMLDTLSLFPPQSRIEYLFGDITQVPDNPKLLKSRPISTIDCENENSVLLPLNRLRHFKVVKDERAFKDKKDACVWRGVARQPHRIEFLERYSSSSALSNPDVPQFDTTKLNVGCTDKHSQGKPYHKEFMSIQQQLEYKYILSIEGYDVATNLKWAMHSNSLCFMRKPRYETWYMEGSLEAGKHYVELQDDYSDLTAKMDYYQHNPKEAEAIIANAQAYFASFLNPKVEAITAYKVVEKYLMQSGQNIKPLFVD